MLCEYSFKFYIFNCVTSIWIGPSLKLKHGASVVKVRNTLLITVKLSSLSFMLQFFDVLEQSMYLS